MIKDMISVIVSVYNVQDYLKKAVESILTQRYQNLEIILVDDGSTDESGKICDAFARQDKRVKVIHQNNRGLSGARNAGIEIAKGEYIAFVDGDDWIDPDMYQELLTLMKRCQAPLGICSYKEIRQQGTIDSSTGEYSVWEGREALEVFIREDERYCIQNAAWNKLYTRALMGELKFPEGKLFEDIVYTTKLIAASPKTVYLDCAYYNYVVDRGGSIMNSKKGERILSDQVTAYQEKGEFLRSIGEENLYRIHQSFFLKRMLLHYREASEQQPEGWKTFLSRLRTLILREVDWSVYHGGTAGKGEYVRLRLFTLSPKLYLGLNRFYEGWVIPLRQRRSLKGKKQIIIVLSGGLGNQMFQYALYLYFQTKGVEVKIDDVTEYVQEKKRRPELAVFGIRYQRAAQEEICHWTDAYLDLPARLRRKLFGRKTRQYTDTYGFQSEVLELEDGYLYGWWQSERYFLSIADQVRRAFTFPEKVLTDEVNILAEEIRKQESVGVHVRRGDYLEADELYGGICTEGYYQRAMERMRKSFPGCRFFLFTNDPAWAKEHMQGADVQLVEGNDENSGYLDLYLMSQCKHNIIANSTFSWWAAWLNENPNKRVIAPAKWMKGRELSAIYAKGMETCI